MKNSYLKTLTVFICITLVVGFLVTNIIDFTYASISNDNVDCQVTITGYQQFSTMGDILNTEELWEPGMRNHGVLEILNNFGKVEMDGLGIKVKSINNDYALEDFLNFFYLTVEQVKFSAGNIEIVDKLLDNKSFNELSKNSVELQDIITTYKGDSTYLKYSVLMSEEAPMSLIDIQADISFTINIVGYDDKPKKKKEKKHWAHDCIETLLKYGIIQGYPDGTIQPEENITRAEAAVLIANALNIMPDDTSPYPYQDKSHPWYRGHVISGSKEDVVRGYLDGTFKPSKYISREEMTAMLIRGFEKKASESKNLSFVDSQKIADWAVEYVRAAAEHKVVEGYPDDTFRPQRNITRGEAFTIICKLLGLHHLHEVK